jgi:SAM-dependent methyltransferase
LDHDVRVSDERLSRAALGFSEGERYERSRPGYPSDAVDALCAHLGIGPETRVLDLAAGTGKLTRELCRRAGTVVAVEPVAGMRATLHRTVPDAQILDGRAEAIPLEDASADAITVAQAFHWFDGDAAVAEIARVLRPGCRVGLMWNVMDETFPWVAELQELIHVHRGANPWYRGHLWRSAFVASDQFAPLEHVTFRNAQMLDVSGVLDRVASVSFVETLEPVARDALLDQVRDLVTRTFPEGGTFEVPYVIDLFWSRRMPV